MTVRAYLDCGCALMEGGGRSWCPTCAAEIEKVEAGPAPPEATVNSDHIRAARRQLEKIGALQNELDIERENYNALARENARLREALEADATDLWTVTNAIKREVESRTWILDGRGPYEWDDDRYRQEAGLAFEAVLRIIKDAQRPAANRFHNALTGDDGEAER